MMSPSFERPLGSRSPILNSISQKRLSYFYPAPRWSPEGKHPLRAVWFSRRYVVPQEKPKINTRKTTRINLAACAEKLGDSVIALSHTSTNKRERRKIAGRQWVRDEGNKHRNGESWEQMDDIKRKTGADGGTWGLSKVCNTSLHWESTHFENDQKE